MKHVMKPIRLMRLAKMKSIHLKHVTVTASPRAKVPAMKMWNIHSRGRS